MDFNFTLRFENAEINRLQLLQKNQKKHYIKSRLEYFGR